MSKIYIGIITILMLFLTPCSVMGLGLPSEYPDGFCELAAKDFQRQFGGSLIWIQPLDENGAYALSEYGGHLINSVYIKGNQKVFYIDYGNQMIFSSMDEVDEWYSGYGREVEVWDLSKERPPFGLIWHY